MIIGVAQLCNKVGGEFTPGFHANRASSIPSPAEHFSMEDETLALQFSAYCAISIHQARQCLIPYI